MPPIVPSPGEEGLTRCSRPLSAQLRCGMWILIVVSAYYSVPPSEVRFDPRVSTQEFSTKKNCELARSFLVDAFGGDLPKMSQGLQDQRNVGEIKYPQKVLLK